MQEVLSGTGLLNSRGRAQQILILQQKVKELQLQAKQNHFRNKDSNISTGKYIYYIYIGNRYYSYSMVLLDIGHTLLSTLLPPGYTLTL